MLDQHSPISDAPAIEPARRMWSALPRMHADPSDPNARADAQAAAWLSIQGRSGGVSHGASHGIGYLLGGGFNVPHGPRQADCDLTNVRVCGSAVRTEKSPDREKIDGHRPLLTKITRSVINFPEWVLGADRDGSAMDWPIPD